MSESQETNTEKHQEPTSPQPSHITTGEYVALMETNGHECESWYYFIRKQGNEDNLNYLDEQLNKVDWYVEDDLSVFDLDLEHTVTAKTAKQMTKLELNAYQFHRKFDGKLEKIDLGFRKKDKDKRKCEQQTKTEEMYLLETASTAIAKGELCSHDRRPTSLLELGKALGKMYGNMKNKYDQQTKTEDTYLK